MKIDTPLLLMGIVGLLILSVLVQYLIYYSNSKKVMFLNERAYNIEESSKLIINKISNLDLNCPEQKDCPDCRCPDCNCPEVADCPECDCPKQDGCPKQKECPKCEEKSQLNNNNNNIITDAINYLFSTGKRNDECDISSRPSLEPKVEGMNNLNNYIK